MTISAADRVDVMLAGRREKRRIHFLDIDTAVRIPRVAGGARSRGGSRVHRVAVEAAQTRMDPRRSPIVGGAALVPGHGTGRMTLLADPLSRIECNLNQAAVCFVDFWRG